MLLGRLYVSGRENQTDPPSALFRPIAQDLQGLYAALPPSCNGRFDGIADSTLAVVAIYDGLDCPHGNACGGLSLEIVRVETVIVRCDYNGSTVNRQCAPF